MSGDLFAAFVLNAGYLFEELTPLGKFGFVSESLTRARTLRDGPPGAASRKSHAHRIRNAWINRFRGTGSGRYVSSVPYVAGFDDQVRGRRHQTYLLGEMRAGWHYYGAPQ